MRPKVIISNAVSPNGSLTGFSVDYGIYYPILLSYQPDAVMVGADTVLAAPVEIPPEEGTDFSRRTAGPDERRPWWVLVDSRGRLEGVLHFYRRMEYIRDIIILVSQHTPANYLRYLEEREYEYILAGGEHVDLSAALEELSGRYGIRVLVSDTGGRLGTVLLESGLVDELSLVVAPVLSGETRTLLYRPAAVKSIGLALLGCGDVGDGYVHLMYGVIKE